jgi:transcriptional regulator with XRE-family HTH domain
MAGMRPKEVQPLLFGARIRHARLTMGMRQQALADLAGCSKSMLSKIEADRVVPSLPALQRIARALEIELAGLFAGPADHDDIVSRPGSRPVLNIDPLRRGEGIQYERLVPFGHGVLLEANIHIIQPRGPRGPDPASGRRARAGARGPA